MILDNLLNFEPVTGTAVTVTADSTNTIDFGVGRDMGIGDDPAILLVVRCITAFTAAGAATMTIGIQYSADNSTFYVASECPVIPKANLSLGALAWQTYLPRRPAQMEAFSLLPRYVKLTYTVATGPMTAGSLYAGLLLDTQAAPAYAPGIIIAN